MYTYRSILAVSCAGLLWLSAGCASQIDQDALARANLQMQDKLNASQAERVKARTQVAMLRQEVLQARQAQQEGQDQVDSLAAQIDALRARIDVQTEVISRMEKGAPQTQVTVSLSPDTLDKLIQRVQTLTEQINDLRAQNNKLRYQVQIRAAAQEVAALTAQSARIRTRSKESPSTAPSGEAKVQTVSAEVASSQPAR